MATVSLGGSLEQKLDAAAAAGFDGIELLDDDLRTSGMTPAVCAQRCADLGLTIDLYQPFRRAEGVSPDEFGAVLTRFRHHLGVMGELGARSILVVSNTDDDADPSRDLSVSQLVALTDAAAEDGMEVAFEALVWGTHINRVTDAWDAVRTAAHPGLSLVVDTFHLLAGGETTADLELLPDGAVGFLQLADAPWLALDLVSWSRGHRCFPDEGEMDLLTPVASVVSAGYAGPLSLEIFNPGYRTRPPHEVARQGAEALARFAGRLQDAVTAHPAGSPTPWSPASTAAQRASR
ncbi:sugar phosphate isomerase/epimerase family protein [Pseudonocardia abyssalis]|uniref:Sugar phosphate isomerase/epimerase n=1 Tax=Pseudonocardia abyssalis TaxID=2792008 RepID=A0ABS6UVI5_9PSEU|nr:sugar phosphate isomerase/epimerase family protein [Pseudonocardia abyssalis]MBW0113778.1 sugar phosphate isomerase/epimerase [Pseudonocardia abyssalis]MBW0136278.1 sugar phosphate isomerase/epimerase [Pseudonocardia abyssalis]